MKRWGQHICPFLVVGGLTGGVGGGGAGGGVYMVEKGTQFFEPQGSNKFLNNSQAAPKQLRKSHK